MSLQFSFPSLSPPLPSSPTYSYFFHRKDDDAAPAAISTASEAAEDVLITPGGFMPSISVVAKYERGDGEDEVNSYEEHAANEMSSPPSPPKEEAPTADEYFEDFLPALEEEYAVGENPPPPPLVDDNDEEEEEEEEEEEPEPEMVPVDNSDLNDLPRLTELTNGAWYRYLDPKTPSVSELASNAVRINPKYTVAKHCLSSATAAYPVVRLHVLHKTKGIRQVEKITCRRIKRRNGHKYQMLEFAIPRDLVTFCSGDAFTLAYDGIEEEMPKLTLRFVNPM